MTKNDDRNSDGKVLQFKRREDAKNEGNYVELSTYLRGRETGMEELWDYFTELWSPLSDDRNWDQPEASRKVLDEWDEREFNLEVLGQIVEHLCQEACRRGLKKVEVNSMLELGIAYFTDSFYHPPRGCNEEQWNNPDDSEPPEVVARNKARLAAHDEAMAPRLAAITNPVVQAHKCTRAEAIIHLRNSGKTVAQLTARVQLNHHIVGHRAASPDIITSTTRRRTHDTGFASSHTCSIRSAATRPCSRSRA